MTTPLNDDSILARYLTPAVATAYVPLPDPSESSEHSLDLTLKGVRDEVAELADDATAEALVDAIRALGPSAGRTVVAVAGPEGDVRTWPSSVEMPARVSPGPLPDLGELLAASDQWVSHTAVVVDRIGADIHVVRPAGVVKDSSVEGNDLHITKSQPGGWSQQRFQRSAEEQWHNNASLIADELTTSLEPDELVLLAGDATMRGVLMEELNTDLAGRVVQLETGTRADDGSDDALAQALHDAVAKAAAERRSATQGEVADAIGRDHGATGRADVTSALFQGLVDTLVVHLDTAQEIHVHVGEAPHAVAADASVLHDLDMDATRVRLSDAVLRAAAAGGTTVLVVRDEPENLELEDGVAASLRS